MTAAQAAENYGDEWGLTWYILRDIYINSNLNPLTKFTRSSRITGFEDILPLEHLWNDLKDRPNQHENSQKLCDEMGYPFVNLMESQWKLRQQHDLNFPMEGMLL